MRRSTFRKLARSLLIAAAALAILAPRSVHAGTTIHHDPVAPVVLGLAVILVIAKLGGDLAMRLGQPSVLGELVAGVLLGNLGLVGVHLAEPLRQMPAIDLLSSLGVVLLLFEVGMESTVPEMLKTGLPSLIVAMLGVMAPFGLGWSVSLVVLPGQPPLVHAFIGATLCATSIGITARVLRDLGYSRGTEARIILGAAVVDDVLGLVVLALVAGIIGVTDAGGSISAVAVGGILLKACAFLIGAPVIGLLLSPRLFHMASRLRSRGVLLAVGLAFCFILAWVANLIGLAPIVGAYAAGLILEDVHFRDFTERGESRLQELVAPISDFLAPVFFVVMGMRTDLRAFASGESLLLAGVLTVVAILGKQACSLGVWRRGVDRLSVGIGMIPRGEVGLIFASTGMGLTLHGEPVISPHTFSAIVVMVIVTTLVTPPALKWSLNRHRPVAVDGAAGEPAEA